MVNFKKKHKILAGNIMADHKTELHSESEQMYLVTTATLLEDGAESPVPLSNLAKEMDVLSVSANQMVRKLAEEGLINYQPYRGVELTINGLKLANRILRHRRLWQVFLIRHLDLPFKDAEALACKMEHLTSDEIAERLAVFLGDPQVTPQGRLIPPPDAKPVTQTPVPLAQLKVNQQACIIKINDEMALRAFLADAGLGSGSTVMVEGIGHTGDILLTCQGKTLHLSRKTAQSILVKVTDVEDR
jgi:DtxR family Mn-dependent transcriptional regulator